MTSTDMVIYGLFHKADPDRVRYVGQTIMGVLKRFWAHLNMARNGSPQRKSQPVTLWIRKHGEDAVSYRVLEIAEDEEHLQYLEQFWIAQMRDLGQADLNVHQGGNGGKKPLSAEARLKKVEYLAEMRNDPAKEAKRIEGIRRSHNTPEFKAKMSALKTGEGNPQFGRVYTEDERRALSLSMSPFSEDDIRSIRNRRDSGEPQKAIAESYGVDPSTISKIANRKRFGWVK